MIFRKWKKVILLFVLVVSFALMSNNVSAQTKTTTTKAVVKTEQTASTPCSFVDKNKNGICDKHEAKDGKACTAKCEGKDKGKCTGKEKACAKACGTDKGTAKACGDRKGTGCGSNCKH